MGHPLRKQWDNAATRETTGAVEGNMLSCSLWGF